MANPIVDTIEKMTGVKILRTEEQKEEKPKKKRGNPEALKKMWVDIKAGKRPPLPKPWSKKKAKKEEPKPEIKLGKKSFDKEAEEIKEEIKEEATDVKILGKKEKPIIEPKEIKKEEPREGFDSTWLIYGIAGLVGIFFLMQIFKKSSSSPTPVPAPETPEQDYYEIPRADGSMIKIPKTRR